MKTTTRARYLRRSTAHLCFVGMVWPLVTLLGTAIALTKTPYYSLSFGAAVVASIVGLALSAADMILAGFIFWVVGVSIYRRVGTDESGHPRLLFEPLVLFVATVAGISLWYPAVLSEPLFSPVGGFPAGAVVLLLYAAVVAGVHLTGKPGRRIRLAAYLCALGLIGPALVTARARLDRVIGHQPATIILGLDSLSRADKVAKLEEWVHKRGGTWYEYAVGPGLLTNAVWSSILTMQPVSTHGVFHTFQHFGPESSTLIAAARAAGYRTVSVFENQLTCAVGSTAGFDKDLSGPIGWRQIVLPAVANSSFLVPIVRPLLPRMWPGPSLPNQAGTFSFDVRRELREILGAGFPGQRTLVAAHLTYLHLPAYPRSIDLRLPDILRLVHAPAASIRDRSFDWKDVDLPTDPIALHTWKVNNLLEGVKAEVEAARYIERGGRLVVFSDHGSRDGLTMENFDDERYHHVLLATFGLPSRCPQEPISLTDIGSLLGFSGSRSLPAVEYSNTPPTLWRSLANTAKIRWSGEVELNAALLGEVFKGMRRYVPWQNVASAGCELSVANRR